MPSSRALAVGLVLFGAGCGASSPPPPEPPDDPVIIAAPAPPPAQDKPALALASDEPLSQDEPDEVPPPPEVAPEPRPSPWLAGPTQPDDAHLSGGELLVEAPIAYETGKRTLTPESDPALARVAAFLQAKPEVTLLRVEVHSDSMGSSTANLALTQARAHAVTKALVALGVSCRRLIPVGFGEDRPIADNATAEGRAKNRRTSFFVAALRGKPVAGRPVDGGGQVSADPCN